MSEQALQTKDATQIDAMTLVSQAVSNGASLESVDKLIELVKFNDQREALRAFNKAFTAAQAEFPSIKKRGHVDYKKKDGTRTEYDHAYYSDEVEQLRPVLQKHGFSFRHSVKENDGNTVTVRCILAHKDGHSEYAGLTGPTDPSGGKNNIQAIGSSVTYLKRYTLEAVTGIVTTNDDNDGRGSPQSQRITEQQVADLESLITETKSDKAAFLKFAKVNDLADIHPNAYPVLVKKLRPQHLPAYSDETFKKNLPQWKALIDSGTKTPQQIIATVGSKYTLTDEQKQKITKLKETNDADS